MTRHQLRAIVAILEMLPELPLRKGTPDISAALRAKGLAVSERQLQKYMITICSTLEVDCEEGRPNRYGWRVGAGGLEAAVREPVGALLIALVEPFLRAMLPSAVAQHFDASFRRARETAEAEGYGRLFSHVRAMPEPLGRRSPLPAPEHLDVLIEALTSGRRVRARYKKRGARKPLEYYLGPVGLVSVGPILMLLANKVGEPRVRHFEVQRFHTMECAEEPTEGLDAFDIDAHIGAGELAFPISEAWLDLDLEVGTAFVDELRDAPLAEDQRIEPTHFGARIRARVADSWALRRFILGLGAQAKVRGPAGYARQLVDEVGAMGARYGLSSSDSLDPRERLDLQRGLLVPAASRRPEALLLLSDLNAQLHAWAAQRGYAVLGGGHQLGEAPAPDLCVYRSRQLKGAPLLVLDVLDGETDGRTRVRKAAGYAAQGVAERWVVDPRQSSMERFVLRGGEWVAMGALEGPGALTATELGLTLELR